MPKMPASARRLAGIRGSTRAASFAGPGFALCVDRFAAALASARALTTAKAVAAVAVRMALAAALLEGGGSLLDPEKTHWQCYRGADQGPAARRIDRERT